MDFTQARNKALKEARKAIASSIGRDSYIIQAITNIEEMAKINNMLAKRLRDWYSIYFPELSQKIDDHENFVNLAATSDKSELMKKYGLEISMGADINEEDLKPIIEFAEKIKSMYDFRDKTISYIERTLSQHAPNLLHLLGATLAAKMIKSAGSLKHLAMMHASKAQLLGAETALFRHIKTGAKPPKHGIILQHQLVSSADRKSKGKASRVLADKIIILARTDYFKGKFIAPEIKKALEEKLQK